MYAKMLIFAHRIFGTTDETTIIYSLHKKTTTMSQIAEKVTELIVEKLSVDAADVTPEASFTQDLGADSLDTVELIMELEKVFNVSIPDEEAEKIQTVGDAIAYIENAQK